jgi:Domain of unknown function (DUF397)
MTTEHTWVKSSHSGSEGNCVEVAADPAGHRVLIRDSKNPGGKVLEIPVAAWHKFAEQAKACAP